MTADADRELKLPAAGTTTPRRSRRPRGAETTEVALDLGNFRISWIRDLTHGGKCPSRDYKIESLDNRGQGHERKCARRLHFYESRQPRQ